jgi:uncharacterized protein YidB (DUF937 family)
MSLLGNIIGSALGGGGNSGGGQNMLMQAVVGMINQHGGLGVLQQQFQGNNLGHLFSSWVGTGQNLPVSADQITQALGHQQVQQLAQQAGISHPEAASGLAQLLPAIIDKLTPQGTAPNGSALQQGLASLLSGGLGNLLK